MTRTLALLAGTSLAIVPIAWTGPHPLVVTLAVVGTMGTSWIVRHPDSSLRAAVAFGLLAQVASTHRLSDPPGWWAVASALVLFLFLDAASSAAEEQAQSPGTHAPVGRRLFLLGSVVVLVAALLESIVLADLGSGLLPTTAAIAAVTALVLAVGQLVRTRP